MMINLVTVNTDKIILLCKKYKVKEFYVFGSAVTDKFNDNSDVDFIVQFDNAKISDYFMNFMNFKEDLETLLNKPVDLIENHAIRNPIFRKIVDRDKKIVYERKSA